MAQEQSAHREFTGDKSDDEIDLKQLRRRGTSLSTRFNEIREPSGVAAFSNPFRNLRLSAANDVCRLPGITPATVVEWFGHDMKTALKHYHRTTQQDFDYALAIDPFRDQVIAARVRKSDNKSDNTDDADNTFDNSLPENPTAQIRKTPMFEASGESSWQNMTPTGLEPVLPP